MSITRVPPREAARLVAEEGHVLVDVRTEAEFAAGHPAGAWNAPSMLARPGGMAANAEFVPALERVFPHDTRLVLTCRSGQRSLRAAQLLADAGYGAVVDQLAGFEGSRDPFGQVIERGWRDVGLAVETGPGERSWAALLRGAQPQT